MLRASNRQPARRPPSRGGFHLDATALLYDIVNAADALRSARAFDGSPALRRDRRWQLLAAIERCGGAPTFSDLGRLLRVSKQTARQHALAAMRVGVVEAFPCPDDRRAWQVMLTPAGRRELEAQRTPPSQWVLALLNGLDESEIRRSSEILRAVSRRLAAYERDLRRA